MFGTFIARPRPRRDFTRGAERKIKSNFLILALNEEKKSLACNLQLFFLKRNKSQGRCRRVFFLRERRVNTRDLRHVWRRSRRSRSRQLFPARRRRGRRRGGAAGGGRAAERGNYRPSAALDGLRGEERSGVEEGAGPRMAPMKADVCERQRRGDGGRRKCRHSARARRLDGPQAQRRKDKQSAANPFHPPFKKP